MSRTGRWHPAALRGVILIGLLVLYGCGSPSVQRATPGPHFKVGAPYKINGRWYHPEMVTSYEAVGVASWYGATYHGRLTANGELYDMNALTAAHPTLPLPSIVQVTNLENGRSLVLRVNDRGPFVKSREIDLSRAAARALGFERQGLARVQVRYLGLARLEDAIVAFDQPTRRWDDHGAILVAAGELCPSGVVRIC